MEDLDRKMTEKGERLPLEELAPASCVEDVTERGPSREENSNGARHDTLPLRMGSAMTGGVSLLSCLMTGE